MRYILSLAFFVSVDAFVADQPSLPIICRHKALGRTLVSIHSNMASSSTNQKKRGLYPFAEARKIARGHGFGTAKEFMEYDCPGAYQLPKNPNEVWADDWKGWEDFLGICLEFEEARNVARSLKNIDTEEAYLALFREKKLSDDDIASRLPYRPDLKYKDQWISWDDYLNL
jgi:hypothetical protein